MDFGPAVYRVSWPGLGRGSWLDSGVEGDREFVDPGVRGRRSGVRGFVDPWVVRGFVEGFVDSWVRELVGGFVGWWIASCAFGFVWVSFQTLIPQQTRP